METTTITEKVNSLEAVFEIVKPTEDQKTLLNYNGTDRKMIGAKNSLLSEMITEALNEGWIATPGDRGYIPAFDDRNGGFAFSLSLCADWDTDTNVGSRHAFRTPALSKHAALTFPEVFKEKLNK